MKHKEQIWSCKIGVVDVDILLDGADAPLRKAVEKAFIELTGKEPTFLFSGWNAELDRFEREAVDKK